MKTLIRVFWTLVAMLSLLLAVILLPFAAGFSVAVLVPYLIARFAVGVPVDAPKS